MYGALGAFVVHELVHLDASPEEVDFERVPSRRAGTRERSVSGEIVVLILSGDFT